MSSKTQKGLLWTRKTLVPRRKFLKLQFFGLQSVKYSFTLPKKPKSWIKLARQGPASALEGGPFRIFLTSIVAKHQKIEGGPFGEFFWEKKSDKAEKTEKGDLLVSLGTVYYAEKQENPFWFSSLGQMVQFDTIKLRRLFVELFWSVRED